MKFFCNIVVALLLNNLSSMGYAHEEIRRELRAISTEETAFSTVAIPEGTNCNSMVTSTDLLKRSFPFSMPFSQDTQETLSTSSISYDSEEDLAPISSEDETNDTRETHSSFQSKETSDMSEPIGKAESSNSEGNILFFKKLNTTNEISDKVPLLIGSSEQERSEESITDAEADWFWKMNIEGEIKGIYNSLMTLQKAQIESLNDTDELLSNGTIYENRLNLTIQEIASLHTKVDNFLNQQDIEINKRAANTDQLLQRNHLQEERMNLALQEIATLHSKVDNLPNRKDIEFCKPTNSFVGYFISVSAGIGLGFLGAYLISLFK